MREIYMPNLESKEAAQGEKMIEIKIRFWTDEIAAEPGKIVPKHAWTSGVVRIERNPSHGKVICAEAIQ
jgi:hypothetical protein